MSLEEKRNNLIKLENKRQKLVKLRNEIFYYITDLSLGGYSEEIEEIDKYFTKYFKSPYFGIKEYKEDQFYEYLTFEIIEVKSNEFGQVNVEELKNLLNEDIAAIMMTNPNTLGIFEENIIYQIEQISPRFIDSFGDQMHLSDEDVMSSVGVNNLSQTFDINEFKTFVEPYRGLENVSICIRADYRQINKNNLKNRDDVFEKLINEYEYEMSGGCMVCNDDRFWDDKMLISYHRGMEHSKVIKQNN